MEGEQRDNSAGETASRVAEWVREVLADEAPPAGVARELLLATEGAGDAGAEKGGGYDLHSLWSALTTLAREIGLQGRSFDRLRGDLSALAGLPERVDAALAACRQNSTGEHVAREGAARETNRREMVEVLIDLRERLDRSQATARCGLAAARESVASSWVLRAFGKRAAGETIEAAEAIADGDLLGLERVEELLREWGVTRSKCEGRPFDPGRMRAVEVVRTDAEPEGRVLGVLRNGYEWRGRVIRHAEVEVARPATEGEER
ncbi:MAG: nucleotide exchange factor GrpE [Polyangia bacterium]